MGHANYKKLFFILLLQFFFTHPVFSEKPKEKKITFPYVAEDNCPFEGCKMGQWEALMPLNFYHNKNDKKKSEFFIKKGEKFEALDAELIIEKPGILTVTRRFGKYKIADKIFLIGYKGAGLFTVLYNDVKSDELLIVSRYNTDIKVEQIWTMIWQIKIKRTNGQIGWLKLKNQTMTGFRIAEKIKGMSAAEDK